MSTLSIRSAGLSCHASDRDRVNRSRRTADLFAAMAETDDETQRRQLLDEVVLLHHEVARSVATRYRGRGVPDDDLYQVASEGLVKAARRFDPTLGYDFMSYAVPTMRGEVQRYFRDQGWTVRPPRRVQELQARLHEAEDSLAQELGHEPSRSEVTDALDIVEQELDQALQAYGAFAPTSLDSPFDDDRERTLAEVLCDDGTPFAAAEARLVLAPVLRELGARDRRILYLRYCRGLTQAAVGAEIGVTQMQVSRLLSRILSQLRDRLVRP
jgi:RNA polymerase sigma-B factor